MTTRADYRTTRAPRVACGTLSLSPCPPLGVLLRETVSEAMIPSQGSDAALFGSAHRYSATRALGRRMRDRRS
jgi:hypothetical protein